MPSAVEPAREADPPITNAAAETKVPAKAVAIKAWMVASVAIESVVARIPGPIEAKRRAVGIGVARIHINRIRVVNVGGIRVGHDRRRLRHAGRISAGGRVRRRGGLLLRLLIGRIGLSLDLRAATNQGGDNLRR